MTAREFLSKQDSDVQRHLSAIHGIIVRHDAKVKASVEKMMGKEMIVYKEDGIFKYALANMKHYMTLHAMPMYAFPAIFKKYKALLPEAKFQKGCVNFKNSGAMPLDLVEDLIKDCAAMDYASIVAKYRKK